VNGDLVVGDVALPRTTILGELTTDCVAATPPVERAPIASGGAFTPRPAFLAFDRFVLPQGVRFCIGNDPCHVTSTANTSSTNTAILSNETFSDARRGTSPLRLADVSVKMPDTRDATSGDVLAGGNTGSFRYLVDPGFTSDPEPVKASRLAHQALVRILDGVWYLNNGSWPGLRIWSDHPGTYQLNDVDSPEEVAIAGEMNVGRGQVFTGAEPKRYSWYDAEDEAGTGRGVVSYGRLKLMETLGPLHPMVKHKGDLGHDVVQGDGVEAHDGLVGVLEQDVFAVRLLEQHLHRRQRPVHGHHAVLDQHGEELRK
jgi:hypothetical protein